MAILSPDSAVDPDGALAPREGVVAHGTRARYQGNRSHDPCRCEACKAANAAYQAQRQREGLSRWVSAGSTRTRLLDLVAEGWTVSRIAREAGITRKAVDKILDGSTVRVSRETRRRVRGILDVRPNHISVVSPAPDTVEATLDVLRLLLSPAELAWRKEGNCANLDEPIDVRQERFFPSRGDDQRALEVCWGTGRVLTECPVRDQCLQFALDTNTDVGIWGGATGADRRAMKARG